MSAVDASKGAETEFLESLLYSEDRPTVVENTFSKKSSDYWYWRLLSFQNRWQSSVDKEANKVLAGTLDQAEKLPFCKTDEAVQNLVMRQALINFKKVTPAVKRATIIKLRKALAPRLSTKNAAGAVVQKTPEPSPEPAPTKGRKGRGAKGRGASRKKASKAAGREKKSRPHRGKGRGNTKPAAPPASNAEPKTAAGSTWPSTLVVATPRLLKKKWETYQRSKLDEQKEEFWIENLYTPAAQDFLANQNLRNDQIDSFLRLVEEEAPEVPYLLTFVRKDLRLNKSPFGTKKMHYKLTLGQMELLGKKTEELQDNEEFWSTYAWKLQTTSDRDLVNNLDARGKYLDKLKKFVLERAKKCNNLKALVLINWLRHQELMGIYDKGTLKTYLAIPREQNYNREAIRGSKMKGAIVPNDYVVSRIPCLLPVGDDEPFVRRALRSVFMKGDEPYSKWVDFVDHTYARQLYTEVRLLSGAGNASDLKRTLVKYHGKYAYQELNDRVDIEFSPQNRTYFSVQDQVSFEVLLKNVPVLNMKVYEINARAYYEKTGKEIGIDINVEGLTETYSKVYTINAPAILKKVTPINIPYLKEKRGVFLIELIGNGQTVRMVVRKGELRYIARQEVKDTTHHGGLGYVFRVVNERNIEVKSARVTVNGTSYQANDKTGEVYVPFANEDNDAQPIILEDFKRPGSATLHYMKFETENYRMSSGLFVDRESLLEKQTAKIIVRPALYLNEHPCSISNLMDASLTIIMKSMSNGEEFTSTRVVRCDLSDSREFIYDVTVPTELREINLVLTGRVKLGSQDHRVISLKNVETFNVNTIDDSDALGDLHLIPRGASGYVLAAYGKNGEPIANQIVKLQLTHRYFKAPLDYTLETNEDGLVFLGRLPDVTRVEAIGEGASSRVYPEMHHWNLLEDAVNVPPVVNVMEKEIVRIPFMTGDTKGPTINVYDTNFITKFKNVSYKDGYVEIKGLPVGDFVAMIRDQQIANVLIHVASGNRFDHCAIGDSRIVELSEQTPLQITMVKGNRDKGYRVQLQGYNKNTRVHVFSTFLVPRFTSFSYMASPIMDPQVCDFAAHPVQYGPQRDTSAEYRYIQLRQASDQLPGNMTSVPGLVQNAWCSGADKTPIIKKAPADGGLGDVGARIRPRYERVAKEVLGTDFRRNADPSNLEFLLEPSRVFGNLTPDSQGWVNIPTTAITSSQNLVQIIAVDDNNISMRNVILPTTTTQRMKDTRLMDGLQSSKHYAEVREVLIKRRGDTVIFNNWASSQFEAVDDISDVFELYMTIADHRESAAQRVTLSKFKFLTEWSEMKGTQKLAAYNEFACNEVNFYMFRKDKAFFEKVVKPALQNKFQKDFLDYYMLGNVDAVKSYASFAKFQSLNTFERILLASVDKTLADNTLRSIEDKAGCLPQNLSASDSLFRLTVESKQLARSRVDELMAPDGEAVAKEKTGQEDLSRAMEETRYYGVPFDKTTSDLIGESNFMIDVAKYFIQQGGNGEFLSRYYGESTKNLTQMLLGIALLDLSYRVDAEETPPEIMYANGASSYVPGTTVQVKLNTSTIVLSRQLKDRSFKTAALAVSTNYFDPEDTAQTIDGEKEDKFIKNTMETLKIYGCRVVITNVSSQRYDVEVLAQIPTGSVPVKSGFRTKNQIVTLEPYKTTQVEYYFYFPLPGSFIHYPAHVNKNGVVLGYSREEPTLKVVDPDQIEDTSSWEYFANRAPNTDVLNYLKSSPEIYKVNLDHIAWRMSDERFFMDCCVVLRTRQIYNDNIWAWSLKHFQAYEIEEYLTMNPKFKEMVRPQFTNGTLGRYDPFLQLDFQHTEFWSAFDINNGTSKPRACAGGLTTESFVKQYRGFLTRALFRSYSQSSMDIDDKLSGVYYFLVQDRVKEAIDLFKSIPEEAGRAKCALTYDYMKCYLAFYGSDYDELSSAMNLADKWLKAPLVPSQRKLFQDVSTQIGELKNAADEGGDFIFESAEEIAKRGITNMEFDVSHDGVLIKCKNIEQAKATFYEIDLELQFSTAPFRQKDNAYNFVQPTDYAVADCQGQTEVLIPLPEECKNKNTIVEVTAGEFGGSKTLYDNQITVQVGRKGVGQIRVLNANGDAVPRAYIKVYAQTGANPDGIFFKDGFTDMRGRFDYTTISSDLLQDAKRFAILVQTESAGADVIEVEA